MAKLAWMRGWPVDVDGIGFRPKSGDLSRSERALGGEHLHGGRTDDVISGGAGDDVIGGRRGDDTLEGGRGNDLLRGAGGRDLLDGGTGDDRLYGGTERQENGGPGRDQLDGGAGDDRLYGGFEEDYLIGASGTDRFIYTALSDTTLQWSDTIHDFEQGIDKILFRGDFRADGGLHFIGESAFSGTPGEVRFDAFPTQSQVSIDVDGDGVIDSAIVFDGEIPFQASDFSF